MFRKRKKKPNPAQGSQPGAVTPTPQPDSTNPPPVPRDARETRTAPPLTEAFKAAIEKAADRAKASLASKGKLEPMVFFVHEDGTMKIAALVLRDGPQKDVLIGRIRDKALAENVSAVMVLSETDPKRQRATLSGVSPGAKASVHLNYNFDAKTKTVTSWELKWLSQPIRSPFLDGVFGGAKRL
jgi:hypothetical protein